MNAADIDEIKRETLSELDTTFNNPDRSEVIVFACFRLLLIIAQDARTIANHITQ